MDAMTQAFHALIQQANLAHFTANQHGPQAAGYALARLTEIATGLKAVMDKAAGGAGE